MHLKIFLSGSKIFRKNLVIFVDGDPIAHIRISKIAFVIKYYWESVSLEYFSLNPSAVNKIKIISKQMYKDYKQNGLKFNWNYIQGYKVSIPVKQSFRYLSFAIEGDKRVAWISRSSVNFGVEPYALSHSIEYDFSRFPDKFCAFVWGVESSNVDNEVKIATKISTRLKFSRVKVAEDYKKGFLTFHDLHKCKIHSGKNVLSNGIIYPTDVDNFIDNSWPTDLAVRTADGPAIITSASRCNIYDELCLYFGSSTSWFHFLIEVFPRYLHYGQQKIQNARIVLEYNVPPQILEVTSLLTSSKPVLVYPFESAFFRNLIVSIEARFPKGLDLVGRASDIRLVQDFFRSNSLSKFNIQNRKIFLLRNRNLFRYSKDLELVIEFAKKYNFEFIDTGGLTMKEQISLFSEASHVIGETGSSLTNLLFCQNHCQVFEFNLNNFMPGFFKEFSVALNLEHRSIERVFLDSGEIYCESEGKNLKLSSLFA